MFKKEIKFIYDFNVNEVKKLGNFVTYEQLLSANIHPAIMQYISADIEYLIFEDRQKILRNSIFDYSGEKIRQYFSLIGDEIKKNKRFSLDYMSKLILHASSFTVNYLVRPKWALTKFIFDDEQHKNTTEIKQILNYLYYYGYLRRVIVSYINKKKILSLNEAEFEDLLSKIDSFTVDSNAREIVESSLNSMADFFNIGDSQKRGIIPLHAVENFLAEKGLDEHVEKIKATFNEEDHKVSVTEYLKVIEEVMYKSYEPVEEIADSGLNEDVDEEILIEEEPESEVVKEDEVDDDINLEEVEDIIPKEEIDQEENKLEEVPEVKEIDQYEEESTVDEEDDNLETVRIVGEDEGNLEVEPLDEFEEDEPTEDVMEAEEVVKEIEYAEPAEEEVLEDIDLDDISPYEIAEDESYEVVEKQIIEKSNSEETEFDKFAKEHDAIFETESVPENKPENEVEEELVPNDESDSEMDWDAVDNLEKSLENKSEKVSEEIIDEEEFDLFSLPDDKESVATVGEETSNTLDLEEFLEERKENKSLDQEVNSESLAEELDNLDLDSEEEQGDDDFEIPEELITEEEKNEPIETKEEVGLAEEEQELSEEPDVESIKEEDVQAVESENQDFIDVSSLLESKDLSYVIENVFDYDIEDFAYALEMACRAGNYEEGIAVLEKVFNTNQADFNTKEADALKSVIKEYYEKNG